MKIAVRCIRRLEAGTRKVWPERERFLMQSINIRNREHILIFREPTILSTRSVTAPFIPSVEDLYWLELEVFDRDQMKDFMRRLLGKIAHSGKVADYDYVLFDCPPSF